MARKPTTGSGSSSDDDEPSDAEIVAMTIRHGADYTNGYYDSLWFGQDCDEPKDAEA